MYYLKVAYSYSASAWGAGRHRSRHCFLGHFWLVVQQLAPVRSQDVLAAVVCLVRALQSVGSRGSGLAALVPDPFVLANHLLDFLLAPERSVPGVVVAGTAGASVTVRVHEVQSETQDFSFTHYILYSLCSLLDKVSIMKKIYKYPASTGSQ